LSCYTKVRQPYQQQQQQQQQKKKKNEKSSSVHIAASQAEAAKHSPSPQPLKLQDPTSCQCLELCRRPSISWPVAAASAVAAPGELVAMVKTLHVQPNNTEHG
jgi:hypothetical protein